MILFGKSGVEASCARVSLSLSLFFFFGGMVEGWVGLGVVGEGGGLTT